MSVKPYLSCRIVYSSFYNPAPFSNAFSLLFIFLNRGMLNFGLFFFLGVSSHMITYPLNFFWLRRLWGYFVRVECALMNNSGLRRNSDQHKEGAHYTFVQENRLPILVASCALLSLGCARPGACSSLRPTGVWSSTTLRSWVRGLAALDGTLVTAPWSAFCKDALSIRLPRRHVSECLLHLSAPDSAWTLPRLLPV